VAKVKPASKGKWMVLRRVLLALMIIALGILAAGQLGGAYPLLDLANLILVPSAIAAILLAIVLALFTRRWERRAACALVMMVAGWLMIPPPGAMDTCSADAPRATLAWLNLQGSTQPGPILDWLDQERPDIVGFGELHASVEPTRTALGERYPHVQTCLANGRCSTVLYAASPPIEAVPLSRGDVQNRQSLSAARMTIADSKGTPYHVLGVHLSRAPYIHRQRDELTQLQLLLEDPANTVVIGDFNMVRRMQGLRQFAQGSGLATNPADRSTWPLRWRGHDTAPFIQIDHVLTGRNWRVERLRTSDALGPDHRGLVAELCRIN